MAKHSSAEYQTEVRDLLKARERLRGAPLDGTVAKICEHVDRYFTDKEHVLSPQAAAFRRWWPGAIRELDRFMKWIEKDPIPGPAVVPAPNGDGLQQLAWNRQFLATQVHHFQDWLTWVYSPAGQKGRRVDWMRADLEEHIGSELWLAGIRPTKSMQGTYAQILQKTHHEIGLAKSDEHKSARVAIDRHPEWQNPPTQDAIDWHDFMKRDEYRPVPKLASPER